MVPNEEHQRVKSLLTDTITLLCKNGLTFRKEFSVEATIGITLDKESVMVVSINELVKSDTHSKHASMDSDNYESEASDAATDNGKINSTQYKITSSSRKRRKNSGNETAQKLKKTVKSEATSESAAGDEVMIIKEEVTPESWQAVYDENGDGNGDEYQAEEQSTGAIQDGESPDASTTEGVDWPWYTQGSVLGNVEHGNVATNLSFPLSDQDLSFPGRLISPRRLMCYYCRQVFERTEDLVQHRATFHQDKVPYTFFCQECGKGFTCKSNLKGHINSHHSDQKPFQCPVCQRHFGYKHHLNRHLSHRHGCGRPDNPSSNRLKNTRSIPNITNQDNSTN